MVGLMTSSVALVFRGNQLNMFREEWCESEAVVCVAFVGLVVWVNLCALRIVFLTIRFLGLRGAVRFGLSASYNASTSVHQYYIYSVLHLDMYPMLRPYSTLRNCNHLCSARPDWQSHSFYGVPCCQGTNNAHVCPIFLGCLQRRPGTLSP